MAAPLPAADRITITDRIVDEARGTPPLHGASLTLRTTDGTEVDLPHDLQNVLLGTVRSIASNGRVTIGRMPDELTSTVAADLLGISRPTLMKWARDGEIDSFTVGTHTRFQREEVLRVQALRAQRRATAHGELLAVDEEHGELFGD